MAHFFLKHITKYDYSEPVKDSANQIILTPPSNEFQKIVDHSILIEPNAPIDFYQDYFNNQIGVFTIIPAHQQLKISVLAEVVTSKIPEPELTDSFENQWKALTQLNKEYWVLDYLNKTHHSYEADFKKLGKELIQENMGLVEVVKAFMHYIYNNFKYEKGVTNIETSVDEIWELKSGVCQDFAHLLLAFLRNLGFPSRYVSGYICPASNELRGEGATHAWVEAYIPGYGWLGIDPTNNCLVSDRHIKIAVGRNFDDCTPVKGTYKGAREHTLNVIVIIATDKSKLDKEELLIMNHDNNSAYTIKQNGNDNQLNSYQRFIQEQQQQQ